MAGSLGKTFTIGLTREQRLDGFDHIGRLIGHQDIAARLHAIRRYAGMSIHARFPFGTIEGWTVAQHTLLVAALIPRSIPEAIPYALLHDAHEGYIGDWITPVKQALAFAGQHADAFKAARALHTLEQRIAKAIHFRAGLPFPPHDDIASAVHYADQQAYTTEVRHLIPPHQAREFSTDGLPEPADKELLGEIAAAPMPLFLTAAFAKHILRNVTPQERPFA